MTHVAVVAGGVDQDVQWVVGVCSRRQARASCSGARSVRGWAGLRVVAAAVRLNAREQCAGDGHPSERCVCWRAGEDWYERCAAGDADAIAAWRIEPRAGVRCWRRLRALTERLVDRRERHRPVLWGGRVRRRATCLDRALGYRGFVVLGDRWLQPGMGAIRWCAVCGRETSHSASRGRWFCVAATHDTYAVDRRAA